MNFGITSPPLYAFIALSLATVIFAAVSIYQGQRISTQRDYFHDSRLPLKFVSMTAANITLGTGVVYLFSAAVHQGIYALAAPLGTLVGYFCLGYFLKIIRPEESFEGGFFAYIDSQISKSTGREAYFAKPIVILLSLTYLIVLLIEIDISAKLLSPLLIPTANPNFTLFLTILLFAIAGSYTVIGGIRAVLKTDSYQAVLILCLIPSLLLAIIVYATSLENISAQVGFSMSFRENLFDTNFLIIFGAISTFIFGVFTQFLNVINWAMLSDTKQYQERITLARRVGVASAVLISLFVMMGFTIASQDRNAAVSSLTEVLSFVFSNENLFFALLAFTLTFGMLSILFSTVDSLIVSISMLWNDHVEGRDSFSDEQNPIIIRTIRYSMIVKIGGAFVVLILFSQWDYTVFTLLLTIGASAFCIVPLFVLAGLMVRNNVLAKYVNRALINTFISFVALAFVIGISLQIFGFGAYVGFAALVFLLVACSTAVIWFYRVRSLEQ